MNFVPGQLPTINIYLAEIASFHSAVHAAVCEPDQVFSLPESGDRPSHAATVADSLLRLAPTAFSGFVLAAAAGDDVGAMDAIRTGLTALAEIDPNLVTINGCNSKALIRFALHRTGGDHGSHNAHADYIGPSEARRECYELCAVHGWKAAPMIAEAMDADGERIARKAAREVEERLASEARIRAKSRLNDDPSRNTIFGGRS